MATTLCVFFLNLEKGEKKRGKKKERKKKQERIEGKKKRKKKKREFRKNTGTYRCCNPTKAHEEENLEETS